jgi:G3E family GTPase
MNLGAPAPPCNGKSIAGQGGAILGQLFAARPSHVTAIGHPFEPVAALFDPERKTADVRRWLNETAYAAHQEHDHHHHHDSGHDREIHAFCMTFDGPLDWMTVSDWLGALRRECGDGLLRVKGILNLAGESAPVAIHGVHHVFHPPVLLNSWPDDDRRSRIVFITRGLERQDIEEGWRRLSAAVASASG